MIPIEQVLELHNNLIRDFGGSRGVRDSNLLEGALRRPFQTFDGHELYPTAIEKAAAIIESIVKNHPFIDGNKRTGFALMMIMLWQNKFDLKVSTLDEYNFVIAIAEGRLDFEAIRDWIATHVSQA